MPTSTKFLAPPLPDAAGKALGWTHLFGASRALAIAGAANAAKGTVVVIMQDAQQAQLLEGELAFFAPALEILRFPDWETLPYDRFSPYQDIISDRIATLTQLTDPGERVVILAASTAVQRLPPRQWLHGQAFSLQAGAKLEREPFRTQLQEAGYRSCSQVTQPGEYAIRGSLLDVFAMGTEKPFRIDLFDDEIESLRFFDPESQRSAESIDTVDILPAREFDLNAAGIQRFRKNWRLNFEGLPHTSGVYQDVSEGIAPAGIEYYLPLFFEQTDTLFEFCPEETLFIVQDGVEDSVAAFLDAVGERYELLKDDSDRPLLPPDTLYLSVDELRVRFTRVRHIVFSSLDFGADRPSESFATRIGTRVPIDARAEQPLGLVRDYLRDFDGRALFVADSNGRRETLIELFRNHGITLRSVEAWADFVTGSDDLCICAGALDEGVVFDSLGITLITERQLFGERVQQRRRRRTKIDEHAMIRDLSELSLGSPVVHEAHGVGRFLGLVLLSVGGSENEYLKLEYADADILYVPVDSLHLISRYSGIDPEHAPLHKLGSGQWDKARRKAAERIRDVAAELLEIHARRAAREGLSYPLEQDAFAAFSQEFPFEETPDQEQAIEAVIDDMVQPRPMDRLICGDVGFGKTEVAMRAAFIATAAGRQVAVLVPTTLLASQHYNTFKDRFAEWPVKIAQLSRLNESKVSREAIAGLEDGTVDVVIGTHKLLNKAIKYKQLGLVIVDEEHRFGVRQKEQLKALRAEVDILTLTATPIPRTLNLALSGTRELSLIATPPARRLAIKTFVREWSDGLVREAVLRELSRGGQIYFVHNRVEDIQEIAAKIEAIVPEAKVAVGHGQMRERDLERVMSDFYHGRTNVLVCTTIIETGIDIPNANTIVVNRADRFGLAQLYQLRGRVGRSHHRAYAFLITPHPKSMSADAVKRLEAIGSLEELGMGFTLATHDLEIRGAGEILGDEQSGHIQEIGFGLYLDLLNRTVAALKSGRDLGDDGLVEKRTEIDLHVPALLPEDYLPDVHSRLILYKRIAGVADDNALNELREELIDRFGLFDQPVDNLFRVTSARIKAEHLDIRKIDLGSKGGRIEFYQEPNINSAKIIELMQTDPDYRLDGADKLKVRKPLPDAESKFEELDFLLGLLAPEVA
ncbi:MAG: transcription-repair coupling factor [Pseudomonadota bacterium]